MGGECPYLGMLSSGLTGLLKKRHFEVSRHSAELSHTSTVPYEDLGRCPHTPVPQLQRSEAATKMSCWGTKKQPLRVLMASSHSLSIFRQDCFCRGRELSEQYGWARGEGLWTFLTQEASVLASASHPYPRWKPHLSYQRPTYFQEGKSRQTRRAVASYSRSRNP